MNIMKGMKHNGFTRHKTLEAQGRKLLREWRRMEGLPGRRDNIRVLLSSRRPHLSGCCYRVFGRPGHVTWPSKGIRSWVDAILVLPAALTNDPGFLPLFKHELLHVLLPTEHHGPRFLSWARTVGAVVKGERFAGYEI